MSLALKAIRTHPALVLLAAVPVVEVLARTQGGPPPSLAAAHNPFAAIAAATIFWRYLLHDPRGSVRRSIVYLTPITWLAPFVIEGPRVPAPTFVMEMMGALGILGVAGFVLAARRAADERSRAAHLSVLLNALVLPLAALMISFGLWSTYRLNPVYDGRVYAFEETLGIRVPALVASAFPQLKPISNLATACYMLTALALSVVAAWQPSRRGERAVLTAAMVAGACGFALYFICPVVGTVQAFGALFPHALPAATPMLLTARLGVPRSAMPSLHTAWALLVWFNVREMQAGPALRWTLRLFVGLTLFAVFGPDGQHWLLDVVVAVPFAVGIQTICVPSRADTSPRTTAIVSALFVAAWVASVRVGSSLAQTPAVISWALILTTVLWPLSRLHIAPARESMLEWWSSRQVEQGGS